MSTIRSVQRFANKGDTQLIRSFDNRSRDFFYFHSDGTDYKISFTGANSSLKAYLKCPPLAAIINKKTKSFANGKTFILNKKGKAKEKEATSEAAVRVRELLNKPNPLQTQKEFEAQLYAYIQLYGFCIVLPIRPVGYDNTYAKKIWNIPPNLIDIEQTKANWLLAESNKDVIKKIVINFGDEKADLPLSEVYIVKDITPFLNSPIFPESRTCSLSMPINNSIGTYESRGKLIDERGALGIISPDAKDVAGPVPLKEEDKIDLQKEFRGYGLKKGQYNFIISSASVKWSQMGIATKDLMLFEENDDNIMRMCDGYDFPYPLISSKDTNSLGGNKIGESKTLLYQDAIIPESESICEQFDAFFEMHKYDLKIVKDYNHVPALQKDKLKEAQWRNTLNDAKKKEFDAGLITLNDWLVALGDDPLPAELGNVRATDVKNSNVPLAVTIGVGGVQGLISVITAQGMSVEARQATLEIVFGLAPADAQRMAQDNSSQEEQEEDEAEEETEEIETEE
jgi:hypothetical protein